MSRLNLCAVFFAVAVLIRPSTSAQATESGLLSVCILHADLFGTVEPVQIGDFDGEASFLDALQDKVDADLHEFLSEEYLALPSMTMFDFVDLYKAQESYCVNHVGSLALEVATGSHPQADSIYETAIFEWTEVMSAKMSADGEVTRRNLLFGEATTLGGVAAYAGAAMVGFVLALAAVVLLLIGAGMLFKWALKKCKRRRMLTAESSFTKAESARRILQAESTTQPTRSFLLESIEITPSTIFTTCVNTHIDSIVCQQSVEVLMENMVTSVCGGLAAGYVCQVNYMDVLQQALQYLPEN